MYQECLGFFTNLFSNDRPLTDIIDADYTFLNQDLAAYYGIAGVDGPQFRRVPVDPAQRGGVLGMGAVLVRAGLPLRTSPIKRGNWVLSHLLGTPPPPPPAVVAQISSKDHDEQGQSIVQQMQRHRSDPKCMSCHERIDPLGIPLESFDAIGRIRGKLDNGAAVDNQTTAADGTQLQGFAGLKQYLMREPQRLKIMRNLCTKFLGYALGRALISSDQALIDRTMSDLGGPGVALLGAAHGRADLARVHQGRRGRSRRHVVRQGGHHDPPSGSTSAGAPCSRARAPRSSSHLLPSLSWAADPAAPAPIPPKRWATILFANGVYDDAWWSKGSGKDMELSESLKPLDPYRGHFHHHRRPASVRREP